MRSKISSWIRQSRHRAKKYGVINNVTVQDAYTILDALNDLCPYCGSPATAMDHPFPISSGAPNVPANVLPICHDCKVKKGTLDLVAYFSAGHLTSDGLIVLLRSMLVRRGGDILRDHVKGVTGIGL